MISLFAVPLSSLCLLALASTTALAAPAPQEKLKNTRFALEASEKRAAALKKDSSALQNELSALQEKLVVLAEATRKREQRLLALEDKQTLLNKHINTAQNDLKIHRHEISALIGSLIRLSHIPPEAVIAMPGELRHTMQAASLLQSTTQQLQHTTQRLTRKLDKLAQDQAALERTRLALAEEKHHMETAHKTLAQELEQRKQLLDQLNHKQQKEQRTIATLTRESHNLQQLLDKLEQERKIKQASMAAAIPRAKPLPPTIAAIPAKPAQEWRPVQKSTPLKLVVPDKKYTSFTAARGKLPLPVAGHIAIRYGQKLRQNQTNRGLTIASRKGNSVIAPYSGEVVFTGPFLDYGRMVILRYDNGYHLLLAGLEEINCAVGQRVIAGEPVGRLGTTTTPGNTANLYLELRHHSKPVDPSSWFS